MKEDTIELHAIVRGRVQGVAFRATIQTHARNLGLVGKVRNCEDSTVELIAQGTAEQLEELLERLKSEPGFAHIDRIESTYSQPLHHFEGFQIAYW